MRILYISEVQWLSQVSRKHQLVRRFPHDWETLFLSPVNTSSCENSFVTREDEQHPGVRYASLPLPKPDSGIGAVVALTGFLSGIGLRAVMSRVRSFKPDAVVCSYLWAAPLVPRLREIGIPVIYDCNDLHTEFYPARPREAERLFRSLVAEASEVVCSSARLSQLCGRGVIVGNGVDLEVFAGRRETALPSLIRESSLRNCRRLVAYVGSVDDRIDFEILERLAAALEDPELSAGIVCVGRVFEGARERAEALAARHPDRVLFTGRAPYEELPDYLSHTLVGIAPFVLDERTRAINPNKLYMYAAMEQNIVTTPFSDDVTQYEGLVHVAADAGEFAARTIEALGDDERRRAVRERIAVPNSWDERADAFAGVISRLVNRPAQ